MTAVFNPALEKFISQLGDELVLAQVLIRRMRHGYELRHVADRQSAESKLRFVQVMELRGLAQVAANGAFRPLKSAPNLQSGWRSVAGSDAELEAALNQLYPGAIADWLVAQAVLPPVTNYREFTARQTGMYRITGMLNDDRAAAMVRVCCHARFCLKRRMWTVGRLAPDAAQEKSLIPCLEPCAVLLEFARKAMRIEQGARKNVELAPEDLMTIRVALETALDHPLGEEREADFNAPSNPRRVQLVLEKLRQTFSEIENQAESPEK